MKLRKTAKLQRNGGSLVITIPKAFHSILEVEKGDKIAWELNDNGDVVIKNLKG